MYIPILIEIDYDQGGNHHCPSVTSRISFLLLDDTRSIYCEYVIFLHLIQFFEIDIHRKSKGGIVYDEEETFLITTSVFSNYVNNTHKRYDINADLTEIIISKIMIKM